MHRPHGRTRLAFTRDSKKPVLADLDELGKPQAFVAVA
jgi:hypothetical protein